MLKYQSVASVLAQSVQQDPQQHATAEQLREYLHHSSTVIISSILVTANGRPVSSFHNSRIPPAPRHDPSSSASSILSVGVTPNISASSLSQQQQTITPYHVDRQMKTKVYGLFASAIWEEYEMNHHKSANTAATSSASSRTSGGDEDPDVESLSISSAVTSSDRSWLAVETDDALFVIHPVQLKTFKQFLLLILVADPATPLGFVSNKAKETAKVLEEGLENFKVFE